MIEDAWVCCAVAETLWSEPPASVLVKGVERLRAA